MQRSIIIAFAFIIAVAAQGSGSSGTELYGSYFAVHRALVAQSAAGAASAAALLAERARDAHQVEIAMLAETVARSSDLEQARSAFAVLSDAMVLYRNGRGDRQPAVAWCGMVRHAWLQSAGPIANPYLGPAMVHCGEFRSR